MSSGIPETYPRLVGDIGGTNARFAIIEAAGRDCVAAATVACADFPNPAQAIRHYLNQYYVNGHAHRTPCWAAIGIANPVTGDWVKMTNHHWSFSIDELKHTLGLDRLLILNDFTALALSLTSLKGEELEQIGGGVPVPRAAKALIGPGTGLGVSGLVPCDSGYTPLSGEGGHVTLPPRDPEEAAVIACLSRRHAHVSAERLISGPGLVLLYETLAEVRGAAAIDLSPHQITVNAWDGTDALCTATVNMFCAMLGTVAGNLALTLGALGGVYIGGGIVPKLGPLFATSPFRSRFESKGRFRDYLASIPTYVIRARYPALTGAAIALDREQARLGAGLQPVTA